MRFLAVDEIFDPVEEKKADELNQHC